MSRPAKTPEAPSALLSELPYEAALRKLEDVVQAMESDDLPLETLLTRYEEGVRLLAVCQAKLAAAEVKITQLERNQAGAPVVTAWATPGGASGEPVAE